MSYTVKSETDEATGVRLTIQIDDGGTESPLEHDTAVIFAVLHGRYINPAKSLPNMNHDFTTVEGIEEFIADNKERGEPWAVFPLYMFDHGNTVYECSENGNPFSCPWDSGRVGIIALKKSDVGDPKTYKPYLAQAQQTCAIYTAWANGEVYGYVVDNAEGDNVDSCWGYIETDGADGYVYEEGKHAMKAAIEDVIEARAFQRGADMARAKEFGMEGLIHD